MPEHLARDVLANDYRPTGGTGPGRATEAPQQLYTMRNNAITQQTGNMGKHSRSTKMKRQK